MLWFRFFMTAILMLVLLSSCGGPDPKQILADAQSQFTAAETAVGRGE